MKLKFWGKENTPETPDEASSRSTAVRRSDRRLEWIEINIEQRHQFIVILRSRNIENAKCKGCLDTGFYIDHDNIDRLYYCSQCNKKIEKITPDISA